MLGTFIIGLVGTSAMVKLDEAKAVAVLGPDHPWQRNVALQVGIRTGLCGSITTFSSWMLEAMQTCLTGNQWLTGIGQIVVGLACVVVSYSFGIQCALLIHHHLWREDAMEDEMLSFQRKSASFVFGRATERPGSFGRDLEDQELDLPRQQPLDKSEIQAGDYTGDGAEGVPTKRMEDGKAVRDAEEDKGEGEAKDAVVVQKQGVFKRRTEQVALLGLVLLTVGSCFGVAYETEHSWIRRIWLAVLFAPFGCILRWMLAKLNYSLRAARFKWVPVGTLAANWTGAVVDFVLAAVMIRSSPGYWGSLIIGAIEDGFCGCLTTVSTLIAEIMTFADLLPFSVRVYTYATTTFVGAFVWGLAFLGWAYWID